MYTMEPEGFDNGHQIDPEDYLPSVWLSGEGQERPLDLIAPERTDNYQNAADGPNVLSASE